MCQYYTYLYFFVLMEPHDKHETWIKYDEISLYSSRSQTCSNGYPNEGSDYILLSTNKKFSHFLSNYFCSDHS